MNNACLALERAVFAARIPWTRILLTVFAAYVTAHLYLWGMNGWVVVR